jgi:hypothetical protein
MMKQALVLLVCLVGCGGGDDDPGARGTFSLTWELEDPVGPISCDEAGVDEIELLATPVGGGQATADQFPCNNGGDTSFSLPVGPYTLQVNALSNDVAVATGAAFEEDLFEGDNDLGHFVVLLP